MSYISSIRITKLEWQEIRKKIMQDHPLSVVVMRSVMRRELGFTDRTHTDWSTGSPNVVVYLDFYDEAMKTLFILTYM